MKFSDLKFQSHAMAEFGTQAKHFFPNGWGISVIQGPSSYGGSRGLYEIAVLKGTEHSWKISYDTHITDDVEGHLNIEEVEKYLNQVERLFNIK